MLGALFNDVPYARKTILVQPAGDQPIIVMTTRYCISQCYWQTIAKDTMEALNKISARRDRNTFLIKFYHHASK